MGRIGRVAKVEEKMKQSKEIDNRFSHVLIVDDKPQNIKVIATILYEKGYKISFANSGEEALAIAAKNAPDLILLDIVMPRLDGFETCRRLKMNEVTRDIPVIFLSAINETVDIVEGFNVGAVDYIAKPVEREVLLSRLNTHLTLRVLRRNLEQQVSVRTRQLRESEEDLAITLDSIADAVITTNPSGIIKRMNPVAEGLTGWPFEEARGLPLEEVFKTAPPFSISGVKNRNNGKNTAVERMNETLHGGGLILTSRDGLQYQISTSAAQIRRGEEISQGVVVVFRDETEKIEKEKQLMQAQKMEAIGTLAGGLAHDFNNALTGIFGASSIIEHRLKMGLPIEKDKLMEHISTIRLSTKRAADMVKQLLTLSHKQDFSFCTVDLNMSLKHVVNIAKNTFDKSIEILPIYYKKPALTNADPTQIEQVLLNFLINASHAMTVMRPEEETWGGQLSLSIEKVQAGKYFSKQHPGLHRGAYWLIRVEDTGVGINDQNLPRIFTPFFTTKGKDVGTGLGLSMAYSILKHHNGSVSVYSENGIGTTFNIYLPIAEEVTGKMDSQTDAQEFPGGEGLILVIDDEALLRNTARAILEECGYNIILAESGAQGIQIYKERCNDIKGVLLDIVMPRMSGKETFIQLKEFDPNIKVLLASGFKQDERVRSILEMGGRGFVQKPYDLEKLCRAVQKYL